MKVITGGRIPIKLWSEDIEDGALEQAKNLANLPFAYKHVALMPDVHQGYGMPIGGVLATEHVVIPNAVGVDIGCGMLAARTNLTNIQTGMLKKIIAQIKRDVPVGMKRHKEPQDDSYLPQGSFECKIIEREYDNALTSLGTLGGGNHFIEIQKGDDGYIWIMIHSGSRNLGKQVADHYNKEAVRLNSQWHSSITKDQQLAFLPLSTEVGADYVREMNYCVAYAQANRNLMIERIADAFKKNLADFMIDKLHNIAHNYAALEHHFGKNVVVHRKGATSAQLDETGIIPGSQGTKSYITRGLGNEMSFKSCSHGAGRKMGRRVAQETLDLEAEQKALDDKGILHSVKKKADLDEAPSAYKDIDQVMANQTDLVEILVELTPLAVIKG